ncbi:hypothetical protein GCM10012289_02330 [Nonomuraea cavernae]|uniref:Uncharacterized protein n=1 Tax=Nonomuraea cavernae TaxID=2045107 RepID=A0A917YRC9_9ACTN|nr:hypothetical protein GCM10012289_02330 [Nonomuraea cavernae]
MPVESGVQGRRSGFGDPDDQEIRHGHRRPPDLNGIYTYFPTKYVGCFKYGFGWNPLTERAR